MLKKISRARLDALRQGWLESRRHLPAARFGPLTALDDSLIRPHTGFNTHPDKNEVLLYYIANGELTHGDSLNNHSVLRRGEALCLHTGTGLRHSELNQSSAPLRLVRMAFSPARPGGAPNYGEQMPTSMRQTSPAKPASLFPLSRGGRYICWLWKVLPK